METLGCDRMNKSLDDECRFCEYYGYDECPIGGCELDSDDEKEDGNRE
jgi:hypothetical protein